MEWLPPLIELAEFGGDWDAYVEAVYDAFCEDWVDSVPTFRGTELKLKRHPYLHDKEATFWHVTSDGSEEDSRLPDLRRCERISWIRALIENGDSERVLTWRNRRGQESSFLFALPDFSFVVVVRDRGGYLLLWTAYPVEYASQRRKLESEYKAYHNIE